MGDSLDPDKITDRLGCEPTQKNSKGDVRVMPKSGREVVQKSGMWRLQARECEPEKIDAQVSEILGQLSSDLDVWQELASSYDIDLFCGLFMEQGNEGLEISPSTLQALGERGILLGLDIYDPS